MLIGLRIVASGLSMAWRLQATATSASWQLVVPYKAMWREAVMALLAAADM